MADFESASWTRALMASTGIAVGHESEHHHASAAWQEANADTTPIRRLQELAIDRDPEVRASVARRADCPIGLQAALAHDRSQGVRCALAANEHLAPAVAEYLMRDRDSVVLKALARNATIPQHVLVHLALHKREEVRRLASRTMMQIDPNSTAQSASQRQPEPLPAAMPFELRDRFISGPSQGLGTSSTP